MKGTSRAAIAWIVILILLVIFLALSVIFNFGIGKYILDTVKAVIKSIEVGP